MKEAEKYYGLTGELITYSTAAVDDLNTEEDIHLGFLDMKSRELVRLSKA
ncbi:hypothetical protein [Marispirochaeta sp.]|nr:hypothetical protein [Marispirochaeta sp.]